ncbi:glycerophosphodiester phosphodiesterase [Clostridium sp. cel8]|jgi:glycerophosphoryl diester phosphodiesterase|uniref:glycerophosphodiester phosphodiesterase n=1 Tax=unclassified Clostridium TaxID=2614128 RepID=UPI0015F570DF|nr:glycerophosphodiester phosphodiesterase [Clostridium sp. cel8]MBA5850536.1 glycerophosphodiester phosphodiesterase [Clostridium sp. cel8]
MVKTLNIAHRGFSGLYPENTMLAFKKAVETGASGIETDVHMTKDNIIVICHDETIDRTTNGSGFIKDYTYSELRKFDAGNGQKIISLDELLDYSKDKNILVNIELKNNVITYKGIEKRTIDKIYEYNMNDHVILSSFNHNSMRKVKEYDSSIKTGLLYGTQIYNPWEYAKKMKADAIHPLFTLIMNRDIIKNTKEHGISINTYTVNDKANMKKLMEFGVDGIITNYPNIFKKLI